MLRHSREMTRHHRERVINDRQKKFKFWFNGWVPEPVGQLSKYKLHSHHCELCNWRHYERERFDWRSEIAQQYY